MDDLGSHPVGFMIQRAYLSSCIAIGLLLVLTSITSLLRPDDRVSSSMPSGNSIQQAMATIDRELGGLERCTIRLIWDKSKLGEREIATVIQEIDNQLDQEKLIGHPLSILRILKALPGDEPVIDRMPMVDLLPPPIKLALYDPSAGHDGETGLATIVFRVQDLGTIVYQSSFERIESLLNQLKQKHAGLQIELTGWPIGRWKNVYRIVSDLALSLGTASIEILIVMGLAFRSLRLGLIAIVPNMIPLSAAGTFMVLTGWPLDIVSVCSFTVCLGIAVDDTIHFLARYREEIAHEPDRIVALKNAFEGVGTGMIMTTLVLVTGFSSVLFSETRDHRVFASLGIITLVSALVCDLLLLPGLLAYFDKAKPPKAIQSAEKDS